MQPKEKLLARLNERLVGGSRTSVLLPVKKQTSQKSVEGKTFGDQLCDVFIDE